MSIALVLGHPSPHSFNAALADAYTDAARAAGATVDRIDLHALDFDPVLRAGYGGDQPLEPDLRAAQRTIERADHLVVLFPVWWGGMPALMKGFVDRVFLPGWAFRNNGGALPDKLLAGRSARLVATMDSPAWWYSTVQGRTVHRSAISVWLKYVGFSPVRQSMVYALRELDAAGRAAALQRLRDAGTADARALPVARALPA